MAVPDPKKKPVNPLEVPSFERERRDPLPPTEREAGILKQKEEKEKLELDISRSLEGLKNSLSQGQVVELMSKLRGKEAREGLKHLKDELEREKTLGGEKVDDDARAALLKLISDAQKAVKEGVRELRLEVRTVNPSPHWEPLPHIYPTNAIPGVRKMEDAPLGKNLVVDVAALVAGTLDSLTAVAKVVAYLLWDLFRLPLDLVGKMGGDEKE